MHATRKQPVKSRKSSSVSASQFKARCLKLMDEVRDRRCEVVITKRGKPVAKLVPVEDQQVRDIMGYAKGSIVILGDIVGPTGEVWDADR
jgi:prevent-host-death family protein